MHGLQHAVLLAVDASNALPGRGSPRQKDHSVGSDPRDEVDGFLSKPLPSFVGVAVRLMRADSESGVQHQDATVSPWCEKTTIVRGRLERRVAFLDTGIDVHQ